MDATSVVAGGGCGEAAGEDKERSSSEGPQGAKARGDAHVRELPAGRDGSGPGWASQGPIWVLAGLAGGGGRQGDVELGGWRRAAAGLTWRTRIGRNAWRRRRQVAEEDRTDTENDEGGGGC